MEKDSSTNNYEDLPENIKLQAQYGYDIGFDASAYSDSSYGNDAYGYDEGFTYAGVAEFYSHLSDGEKESTTKKLNSQRYRFKILNTAFSLSNIT
jgi:hypothetical protein